VKDYTFSELRIRTRVADVAEHKGQIMGPDNYDIRMTGPTIVNRADGKLLAIYLPGALDEALLAESYATLHELRGMETDNRGAASGGRRYRNFEDQTRSRAPTVSSAIVGAFEASGSKQYCRLTAWSGRETEQFSGLFPLFRAIDGYFRQHVPERYAEQMRRVRDTDPYWVVPGTAFTTVTVNNSYPTGIHTDSGDLEEGFSTLAVLRYGNYSGGVFVFPEYRLGVDMKHGDLLLMDAHEWHGNTFMRCDVCGNPIGSKKYYAGHDTCGSERISIVCYYRTKMAECGSPDEEMARAEAFNERRMAVERGPNRVLLDPVEEMALEAG
jgi:hypothetical protein